MGGFNQGIRYLFFGLWMGSAFLHAENLRVHLPVPVTDSPLKDQVCQVLLSHLAKAEKDLGTPHVYLVEENYEMVRPRDLFVAQDGEDLRYRSRILIPSSFRAEHFDPNRHPIMGNTVKEFGLALNQARKKDGQLLSNDQKGFFPYQFLTEAEFGFRTEENPTQEYRVRAVVTNRRQKGAIVKATGLYWDTGRTFTIDPQLVRATPTSHGVTSIGNSVHAEVIIPPEVLAKIRKFAFAEEMVAAPHSREAEQREYGPNSRYYSFIEQPESYFVVRDPESGDRIGYLVTKDLVERWEAPPNGELFYRSHGTQEDSEGHLQTRRFRQLAHFDLSGNRVEYWEVRALTDPLGRWLILEKTERQQYLPHPELKATLIQPGEVTEVDFGHVRDLPKTLVPMKDKPGSSRP